MGNVWGSRIKLSIFGESHGEAIGIVIDGLPPGLLINWEQVEEEMARRAPGQNALSTPRKESDKIEILSGLFEEKTTGAPLCGIIKNSNTVSKDYARYILRPGHADLTALYKYRGFADYRGGGHFSGRLTAPLVFGGAIAKQILQVKGIAIGARITRIHDICDNSDIQDIVNDIVNISKKSFPVFDDDAAQKMQKAVLDAKAEGDSLGGIIECAAIGLAGGLGDPFFNSLESAISSMMFSIPAVKGIEFGGGFQLAAMKGSEANDPIYVESSRIRLKTNHNGGINGGITNGQPLVFRVALKPTPTIQKEQTTVDVESMQTISFTNGGRHDPCIVPRAVPVVEAGLALCLLDFLADQIVLSEKEIVR